jgi:ribosomal protein L7/L12
MALFGSSDEDLKHRIEDLERRVVALERAAFTGSPNSPRPVTSQPAEMWASANVLNLVMQGRKIDAIKLLREETGMSLKHAKDIIDGL